MSESFRSGFIVTSDESIRHGRSLVRATEPSGPARPLELTAPRPCTPAATRHPVDRLAARSSPNAIVDFGVTAARPGERGRAAPEGGAVGDGKRVAFHFV